MHPSLGIYENFNINTNNFLGSQLKNIGDDFMEIIKKGDITTCYQPIISLKDGTIKGYEALSRGPKGTALESPSKLFDLAKVFNKLWELEFICRIKALENTSKHKLDYNIFINVDPDIINDDKFIKGFTREFIDQFGLNPENIVFEITEKNSITDLLSFKKTIDNYKDQGYKIAIDDTGAGYSGLKLITDIHPHFIKLDMTLIRDIDKDGLKYALIKTLYEFCQVTDIKLIAEGIESENELNALIEIGIPFGQGYFIQRPSENIIPLRQEILDIIKSFNSRKNTIYNNRPSMASVGDICKTNPVISRNQTGSYVLEIFNSNPSINGLPVVDDGKLYGLVMRDKFYAKLGTQYGFALFLNRPITLIMDKRPLEIDYFTTLDVVSKLATTRNKDSLYDYIVVTKNEKYYGIVTIKDLLEKSTQLEINYAKHLNPLSGLPGNIIIEKKLEEIISTDDHFTILYMDIDNFKVYNDNYGFENGDKMIQFVTRITFHILESKCPSKYFFGHIGGDDFIIIIWDYDVHEICANILEHFKKGSLDFYKNEDLNNKSITGKNRKGEYETFGLATLSIAGISNKSKKYTNIFDLSEAASAVKKKCKQIWDNCVIIE